MIVQDKSEIEIDNCEPVVAQVDIDHQSRYAEIDTSFRLLAQEVHEQEDSIHENSVELSRQEIKLEQTSQIESNIMLE